MSKIARTVAIILVCAAGLSGCATMPTPQEIATADYGPVPVDYEKAIKASYETHLVDPYSVVWRSFTPPVQKMWGDRINGAHFSYMVCVTYNAKNRMGGYVGYHTDAVMFQGPVIIQVIDGGEWFGRQFC